MLKTTERLSLILTLNKYNLGLELLADFDAETLLRFCGSLEEKQTPRTWYFGHPEIQKELVSDERFFFYLSKLTEHIMPIAEIDSFLSVLHEKNEKSLDYPLNRLITSMIMASEYDAADVFYDYLVNFSDLAIDKEQMRIIIENLKLYGKLLSKPVADLPDAEKHLFMEPMLTNKKLVPDQIDKIFAFLTCSTGLLSLIHFFYENDINITLSIGNYETFNQNPTVILDKLVILHNQLGKDKMILLVKRWLENNCPFYDLDVLSKTLKNLDSERLEDVLYSRSGYINLIYGSKINSISLSELPYFKEDILIYAITNKKTSFIKLVEDNNAIFSNIGAQSILFKREFYANYINLNSLNADNLLECGRMDVSKMLFSALEFDRIYTFEEIKALYGLPEQYYKLYAKLKIPRVDNRLITFKQLIKQKLLADLTADESINILADKFTQKPFSKWREQNFNHIEGLKPQDVIELLFCQNEIERFIPQMKTRTDARLILRNRNDLKNYITIDEMKGNLMNIDNAWSALVKKLGFTDEFLRQNQKHIIEFLCRNGAEIAKTYYDNLTSDNQRESMKWIIKAELMGDFSTLKYYADDLRKEIDYPITGMQKAFWMKNTESDSEGEISVKECDDFYSTMLVGTMPQRTCLSYIDGQYKDCLLSNFDSNKKILYAYVDGKIVGRAILRLTKGRFNNVEKPKEPETSLSFVDLEALQSSEIEPKTEKERLILFLERPYSAGISDEAAGTIENMYIDLMAKKAEQMGVMLVLSNSYEKINRADFTRTLFHVYISKSKSGAQYLDSLNGSAKISDEGGYRSNNFYIRRSDMA